MRSLILILVFSILLFACSHTKNIVPVKDSFARLGRIFSDANWQLIKGNDTACFYFSRINDTKYDVFQYKIKNGDSSGTSVSFITATGDSIRWDRRGRFLLLFDIDSNRVEWREPGNTNNTYIMQRIDDSRLKFHFSGQPEVILNKTLPIRDFLRQTKNEYEQILPVDSNIVAPVR